MVNSTVGRVEKFDYHHQIHATMSQIHKHDPTRLWYRKVLFKKKMELGGKSYSSKCFHGRLQSHNILRFRPGPTSYACWQVISGNPVSSFTVLVDKAMLRNMQKCTVANAQTKTGDPTSNVSLQES